MTRVGSQCHRKKKITHTIPKLVHFFHKATMYVNLSAFSHRTLESANKEAPVPLPAV